MSLFREGGPHRIKRVGHEKYEMSITLPADEDGRTARACPEPECAPGFFKVRCGTGLTGQAEAFCPYCRHATEPNGFMTQRQKKYATDVLEREAATAIEQMFSDALGLGSTGRRSFGGGLLKVEMELKRTPRPQVRRPREEVLKRDVICPHCTLDHSVYGFAFWCPDCGRDIFMAHVRGEVAVVEKILSDVERREKELGPRIAAHDIGNALEDLVSIFEATLKIELRRFRRTAGDDEDRISDMMRKIGSRLQSVTNAAEIIPAHCGGLRLFEDGDANFPTLARTFEKRHPITHNLGVVDRKYLERVQGYEEEGKDVDLSKDEILHAAVLMLGALERLHVRLHPPPTATTLTE